MRLNVPLVVHRDAVGLGVRAGWISSADCGAFSLGIATPAGNDSIHALGPHSGDDRPTCDALLDILRDPCDRSSPGSTEVSPARFARSAWRQLHVCTWSTIASLLHNPPTRRLPAKRPCPSIRSHRTPFSLFAELWLIRSVGL